MTGQSEISQQNHHRAVRFFWALLVLATSISLAGNVWHAMLVSPPGARMQAVAGATIAPIFLLMSVHGIAVLARTSANGAAYRTVVAAVALIGAGAFIQSFVALRGFAEGAAIPAQLSWITPVVIDATIAASTLALVVIGDKPTKRPRTATSQLTGSNAAAAGSESAPVRARSERAVRTASSAKPAPAVPAHRATTNDMGADQAALAQALVDAGATTKPVAVIESILSAHERGTAVNRIATEVGVHHKTVSRIIDAAEDLQRRQLVAV